MARSVPLPFSQFCGFVCLLLDLSEGKSKVESDKMATHFITGGLNR